MCRTNDDIPFIISTNVLLIFLLSNIFYMLLFGYFKVYKIEQVCIYQKAFRPPHVDVLVVNGIEINKSGFRSLVEFWDNDLSL